MKSGFSLVEVVVSLLLLEVAMIGVLGNIVLAADILHRTERLERATATAEAVIDSLRGSATVGRDSVRFDGGWVRWDVGEDYALEVGAWSDTGEEMLTAHAWLPAS